MGIDLLEVWEHMSIIVKIITILMVGMSVYMFYIIAERLLTYRAASDQSIRYVQALGEFLRQHKVNEALNGARAMGKSPVAKVMESGLGALLQGREALKTDGPDDVGNFDLVDSVNRALERVKERETSNLRRGLAYLGTVASATPFIGLLGTVIGILGTFQELRGGNVTIQTIGPSISEALVSTAIGLGVAIIAAMAFNFFTARVEQYVIDMNDVSSEFIDYVLREGRG
ncbi:MAG: MotA/TolQ/ExbB proton channel family protein [Deltaproteobacteria bacterium]|nr:MotA/TolQ/ExbB proton channel family protein [Deltaproteobacteria bacterium]MCW5804219.1 MotA/TolQ/ExbB proton channel family protein [Deltaproteobacteria bacterium]